MTDQDSKEPKQPPGWVDNDPFKSRSAKDQARASSPAASEAPTKSVTSSEPKDPADEVSSPPAAVPGPSPRKRRTTQQVQRARRTAETIRAGGGRKVLGLPIWGWVVLVLVVVAALLIVFDVRNRSRFRLVCHANHLELQQGRRLMWPFGFETVGGRFKPLSIPADADCRDQLFHNQQDTEAAFLDLLLTELSRVRANNPNAKQLKNLRALAFQALQITRANPHRTRRREAEQALADIAYRQGRAGLARVEDELRTALGHLQEAQKRAGDRYEDLDDWITHLETLLRTVAPAPGTGPSFGATPPLKGLPIRPRPSALPPSKTAPTSQPRPLSSDASPDAGPAPAEAGAEAPPTSGGILM